MKLTQGCFSFLPPLTDDQITKQVQYCLTKGWAVNIEFTDDPHPRNNYWEMWGLPMFDLEDGAAVVYEINECRRAYPSRYIRLNAQHGTNPRWCGDSVGRWEGDTLVVDTVNFHPEQFSNNSDRLHMVERFTRVAPDRLLYQFRIEDPGGYSEPWGGEYEFHASSAPQYEYACHEGNHGLQGILAGARADEAAGKKRQ